MGKLHLLRAFVPGQLGGAGKHGGEGNTDRQVVRRGGDRRGTVHRGADGGVHVGSVGATAGHVGGRR